MNHEPTQILEVTITHNLDDTGEVRELWERRLIALDWGRKGPDPQSYSKPAARSQVELFHEMRRRGAAVIAAYKGATGHRADRLVGWVEPGSEFVRVNGLLCLPLARATVVDASSNFLGNLAPRQCTVQPCRSRARGRLAALVLQQSMPRSIWSLHHLDVEWLVMNYLMSQRLCDCAWSGGRCFECMDHAGLTPDGRELIAQTSVSNTLVAKKAAKLLELRQPNRLLYFFGPAEAAGQCPPGITFVALDGVQRLRRDRRWPVVDRSYDGERSGGGVADYAMSNCLTFSSTLRMPSPTMRATFASFG